MKRAAGALFIVFTLVGMAGGTTPSTPAPGPQTPVPASPDPKGNPVMPHPGGNLTIFRPEWLDKCNADHDNKITRQEFLDCFMGNFDQMDKDKDGFVTKKEYDDAIADLKKRYMDRAEEAFKKYDPDGDGTIDFKESGIKKQEDFDRLDTDKDGTIDKKEYVAAAERRWPEYYDRYYHLLPFNFASMDDNRDGKISREEMQRITGIAFDMQDLNHDGQIDAADATIAAEHQKAANPPAGNSPVSL